MYASMPCSHWADNYNISWIFFVTMPASRWFRPSGYCDINGSKWGHFCSKLRNGKGNMFYLGLIKWPWRQQFHLCALKSYFHCFFSKDCHWAYTKWVYIPTFFCLPNSGAKNVKVLTYWRIYIPYEMLLLCGLLNSSLIEVSPVSILDRRAK